MEGHWGDRVVWLAYEDGKLYGDPEVIEWIKRFAKDEEGHFWGPMPYPQTSKYNHLENPYWAADHMRILLARKPSPIVRGNWPKPPELPPGAVI
jgi:hypothetical protein